MLHGDIRLEGSEGLHAPVAVNLSQTVREVLPSLEPKDAEAPVINALRKEVDRRQIEFLKSGKLLPVPFSSRHYDFKRQQWVFGKATDEAMAEFVERKVYWQTKLGEQSLLAKDARNGALGRVWIGDPTEAQYLQTTPAHLMEVAARLVAAQGLLRIEGEWAEATAGLMGQAERFESARRRRWRSWRRSTRTSEGRPERIASTERPLGLQPANCGCPYAALRAALPPAPFSCSVFLFFIFFILSGRAREKVPAAADV